MKLKNKRQFLLAVAIGVGVLANTSANTPADTTVINGQSQNKPVLTSNFETINASSLAPVTAIDTRSHVWQTTDGKQIALGNTVKVFDLKKTMEANMADPSLYGKIIDLYNVQYAQVIRSLAQKDNLDVPSLTEYNKNTIKNLNLYQFQAQDAEAHHVAYGIEVQLEPDSIVYSEEGYQLSRKVILQMIEAAEKDNNKEAVQNLQAELKQYDDFYQNKRVGYHPNELYRWSEIQNREKIANGKNLGSSDIYAMQIMQQFSQSFANQQAAGGLDMQGVKPEQKEFMTQVQALQEATLKTMKIENLSANAVPQIKENTALGKLVFNHQRSNIIYDGYQVPTAGFSMIRYEATGPIITIVMTNDADGEFWQQQFERILQLK